MAHILPMSNSRSLLGFYTRVSLCGDGHVNESTSSVFHLFLHYHFGSVTIDVVVGLNWHVPSYSCFNVVRNGWFMFEVLFVLLDAVVLTDFPMDVGCCFVVLCVYSVLANS